MEEYPTKESRRQGLLAISGLIGAVGVFHLLFTITFLPDELLDATWKQDHSRARWMVDRGHNVNVSDDRNRTALMWAISLEDRELVRLYLGHGANVNDRDTHKQTALSWAELTGDHEIIALVKNAGGHR